MGWNGHAIAARRAATVRVFSSEHAAASWLMGLSDYPHTAKPADASSFLRLQHRRADDIHKGHDHDRKQRHHDGNPFDVTLTVAIKPL